MTRLEALRRILEISYSGHPDGRETRLELIGRICREALSPDRPKEDDDETPRS